MWSTSCGGVREESTTAGTGTDGACGVAETTGGGSLSMISTISMISMISMVNDSSSCGGIVGWVTGSTVGSTTDWIADDLLTQGGVGDNCWFDVSTVGSTTDTEQS